MAEDSESGSKTEEASQRKLDEARKQGDVAKSADLTQVISLTGAFGALTMAGGWIARNLVSALLPFLAHPDAISLQGGGGAIVARQAMMAAAPVLAVVLGGTILAGVSGNLIQTGFIFTTAKLAPNFSKVSPMEGFKRLFGIDGLMHFARSALKILLTGAVAWWVLAPKAHELQILSALDPAAVLPYAIKLANSLMMAVLMLLGGGAVLDWLWQRQRFMSRMKMTKEEQKDDYKQSEGDPHIKGRLRQMRMERAKRRMIQAVPNATVVVMNPTHFAVALRYVQGETPAPLCVAKGVDAVALKIREVAEAHGVTVIEDPPLARALFSAVEIDQTIPQQHYEAVAKIIGFILSAKNRSRSARQL